ncbi:MAG: signal peptidase I [bacterium]
MKPPRLNHWLFDWSETIVVALVLALIIRAFFIQIFWIPSGSMEPTLNISDRIVVNKVIYNFREPRREEIIVFRQVGSYPGHKKDLIKRVIGLPGEILQIRNGFVFINDEMLEEQHPLNREYSDFGPVTIPEGHYFMMGDNRPASADSRYWGFLPRKLIIGPAFLRIWPLKVFSLI